MTAYDLEHRMESVETRLERVEADIEGVQSALAAHAKASEERTTAILTAVEQVRHDYSEQGQRLLGLVEGVVTRTMTLRADENKDQRTHVVQVLEAAKPLLAPVAAAAAGAMAAYAASQS